MKKLIVLGKKLKPVDTSKLPQSPDWKQCNAQFINQSLKKALEQRSGGWFVVDSTKALKNKPTLYIINNKELVVYKQNRKTIIAANFCPHLGGPLAKGRIKNDKLICPWHGLDLPHPEHKHWQIYESYDDGLLTWVQLGTKAEFTSAPILPSRPKFFISAIMRKEVNCDPSFIIKNRLDPWHGAHYHPHTFARLKLLKIDLDQLLVRVAYRIFGRFCVEVDATFHSPEPNTIVMTIVDGEGKGSLVETHATPITPGKTMVTEVILATSEHIAFKLASLFPLFVRPGMKKSAAKLWLEDAAYAERIYTIQNSKK